jgi:hypothetical protein
MNITFLLLVDLAKYSVASSLSLFSKYYIFTHIYSFIYKKHIANGTIHYIYTISIFTIARSAKHKWKKYYWVSQIVENSSYSKWLGDLLIHGIHCNTWHHHALGKSRAMVHTNHSEVSWNLVTIGDLVDIMSLSGNWLLRLPCSLGKHWFHHLPCSLDKY